MNGLKRHRPFGPGSGREVKGHKKIYGKKTVRGEVLGRSVICRRRDREVKVGFSVRRDG